MSFVSANGSDKGSSLLSAIAATKQRCSDLVFVAAKMAGAVLHCAAVQIYLEGFWSLRTG